MGRPLVSPPFAARGLLRASGAPHGGEPIGKWENHRKTNRKMEGLLSGKLT